MMNPEKIPVVTEEPLPGWLRFEIEGQKPWFKTPVPRTVIRDATKLQDYLEKEHAKGRMCGVNGEEFSFKRRFLKKSRQVSSDSAVPEIVDAGSMATNECNEGAKRDDEATTVVQRLTRDTEVVDHRKLLSRSSKVMDDFRMNDGYQTPTNFEQIKDKISSSPDLQDYLYLKGEVAIRDPKFNSLFVPETCFAIFGSTEHHFHIKTFLEKKFNFLFQKYFLK